jgi:hypothetical protein
MTLINLQKKVDIVLTKRNLINVKAQVALSIDISGSMQDMYRNGTVQKVVDRVLAVATRFDDNGSMDMWTFNTGFDRLEPATETNFNNYVKNEILNNNQVTKWGGTNYGPVLKDVVSYYFPSNNPVSGFFGKLFGGNKPTQSEGTDPAMLIFITDGENFDEEDAERVMIDAHKKNIYFQLVGIGHERFNFLKRVADKYDNVGFLKINDIETMSEDDLYEGLITQELAEFIKK